MTRAAELAQGAQDVIGRRVVWAGPKNLDLATARLGRTASCCLKLGQLLRGTLVLLNLAFNALGPDAAEVLGASLERDVALRTLDLTSNELGDAGVGFLSRGLRAQRSGLAALLLGRNAITTCGAQRASASGRAEQRGPFASLLRCPAASEHRRATNCHGADKTSGAGVREGKLFDSGPAGSL